MKLINFLKKLLQKKKTLQDIVQQSTTQQSVAQRCATEQNFSSSREIARRIVKEMHIQDIRQRNIERQRSVLGYGLHGKFRPRPAHEKKTWKLHEKPEKD